MNEIQKTEKPHLFKEGQIANPKGRGKGTVNKITNQMRTTFADLFEDNKHQIQVDLDSLEPKDRMRLWVDLLPYFTPKLVATKAEITVKQTGAEHLSSAELTKYTLEFCSAEEIAFEDVNDKEGATDE